MEHTCHKCNVLMIEAEMDSMGPIRVAKMKSKKGILGFETNELTNINPFVCPSCSLIEFYAKEPEKLR